MELLRYNAALAAINEATRVDEVKEIRDKAEAVKAYALQIRNVPMLTTAAEVIFRAQVRAGELLIKMAQTKERGKGRAKKESPAATLSDLKISKSQSSRWQSLASLPKKQQEDRRLHFVGRIVSAADGTGKMQRMEMKRQDEERVKKLKPIEGRFKTLIVDPPWDYEWLSVAGRAKPGYATMSHDELMRLNVQQWADTECHLYLWVTNNFMTRGVELMQQWGFDHKTVLTWVKLTKTGKPWFGLGSYFRNSTEHVLFGVKGDLRTRPAAAKIPTHFTGKIGAHSEKPNEFYDIVRKSSYLPAGELFQRAPRGDFTNIFQAPIAEAAE